jgi:O-Antigen ligase
MAVDSKSLITGTAIFVTILVGIIMAVSVTTNAAGGIAAMVPLITTILVVLAIFKPKQGLLGLAALVIWVDEFKRLAVYYGGADSMTVIQTLAMPFIVLAALNFGFLLNLMFRKVRIDRFGILFYCVAAVIGGAIFITMDASLAERGQRAANMAGYMTLVPIAYTYLKTFDEWRRFFSFQVVVALPAAAWAIKQYYFGFDQIEWEYARSGLSMVHYSQMFAFVNPRSFGFFGSASALGCAAIYCAYASWHGFRFSSNRPFWFFAAAILIWVLIASTQRTALIYPLLVLVFAYGFRTRMRTVAIYTATIGIFVAGVISSDYMLDKGLEEINRAISNDTSWGSEVLKVSTFSDRLRGWQRLKRSESWSLFGTQKEIFSSTTRGFDVGSADYNHDLINKILINYGIIGILVILIPAFFVLRMLHNTVYLSKDRTSRNDAAFALSLSLPMIFLSFVGGDNFNANPINIQIWTAIAGVFVCRIANRESRAPQVEGINSISLLASSNTI